MFRVTGVIENFGVRTLVWDDGALSGDASAIIGSWVGLFDGIDVGPLGGPYTTTEADHLRSGLTMVTIALMVFNRDAVCSGDVPQRAPIPEGAIG